MLISNPPSALVPERPKSKVVYIDHLKILLTVLVILHHTFITYGAPGGWYYTQKTTNAGALIPMTMFVAVNQAFFMGFFFFLSALFVPSSYNKKGAARFVTDRLIRLGIPLVFYSFILSPAMNYLVYYFGYDHHITLAQFLGGYDDWIDFGVLWFVVALLLFTLLYVLWRKTFKDQLWAKWPTPSISRIILFATGLGAFSFLVRIIFPIGWVLKPVGFQLGHFPQYIVLFVMGLIASQSNWLDSLDLKKGKIMTWIAACTVIIIFPLFYVLLTWVKFPSSYFSGGLHWPSLLYALWEQLTGLTAITALLCIGKHYWNKPSVFLNKLSRSAFAVYIFHPLIIISLSLAAKDWNIDPALKLLAIAPFAVVLSFALGLVIVLVPGVRRII